VPAADCWYLLASATSAAILSALLAAAAPLTPAALLPACLAACLGCRQQRGF
jgi:hypothetical protein